MPTATSFNGNIVQVKACENDVRVHNVNVKLDKERTVGVRLSSAR